MKIQINLNRLKSLALIIKKLLLFRRFNNYPYLKIYLFFFAFFSNGNVSTLSASTLLFAPGMFHSTWIHTCGSCRQSNERLEVFVADMQRTRTILHDVYLVLIMVIIFFVFCQHKHIWCGFCYKRSGKAVELNYMYFFIYNITFAKLIKPIEKSSLYVNG